MAETSDSNTRPDLPSSGSPPNKDFWYSLYTSGSSDGGDWSNSNFMAAAGSSRLDYEWGHVLNKSRETKNKRRKKDVGGGSRSAVNSSSDLSEALSAISAHLSLSSSSGSGDKDEFFKRILDFWTGTENFCTETEEWRLDEKMKNRTVNNLTSDIHSLSSEGGDDDTLSSDSDDNGVQADLTCDAGEEMQKDGSQLPEVGMIFPSEEEAYNFYKIYAREIGFNVRKGKVQRLCNGSIRKRYFFCSRQGLKKQSNKIAKYKRKETRTGCNAKIQFTVENGKWVISQFTREHNHQLEGQSRNVGLCSKPTEVHPVVHLQNEAATEEDIGATEPAEFGFVDCRSHVLGKTTNGLNPVDAPRLVNGDGDETVSEKKTCIYSSMNELVHKALDFIAKSVADQKILKTAEGILGKALAEIKDSLTPKSTEHFSTTDLEVRSEGNHQVQHQTPDEVPKAVFEVGSSGGLDPPLSLQKDVGIKIVDGSKGNKRNLEAVLGMQRGCNDESTWKKVRLCEKQAAVLQMSFKENRDKLSPNQVVLARQVGGVSSLQMDFGIRNGGQGKRRDMELVEAERAGSRASDDEENGSARKELRLSKEQSAFLEESFKEHSSLNPKQKLALARQLNLRPRQVEVWFQNRRARTKLKQTEVDCEYLKRCCETLTEENRRLQKELQELKKQQILKKWKKDLRKLQAGPLFVRY